MLDFLATTDVGRRILTEEGDAVSEVPEAELREFLGEQGVGAKVPGAGGDTTVPTHAQLHGVCRNGLGAGRRLSFVHFVCPSRSLSFLL